MQNGAKAVMRQGMMWGGAFGLLMLAACGDVPEVQTATSARAIAADYPQLVALDPLLAGTDTGRVTEATGEAVAARVAALRARANRLRRAIIEPARKRDMQQAVARHR